MCGVILVCLVMKIGGEQGGGERGRGEGCAPGCKGGREVECARYA